VYFPFHLGTLWFWSHVVSVQIWQNHGLDSVESFFGKLIESHFSLGPGVESILPLVEQSLFTQMIILAQGLDMQKGAIILISIFKIVDFATLNNPKMVIFLAFLDDILFRLELHDFKLVGKLEFLQFVDILQKR
jgi:hypothetical protein